MSEFRLDADGRMVDPRVCPRVFPDGHPARLPEHMPPGTDHDYGTAGEYVACAFCMLGKQELRDAFRDWRYETVVADLTRAVEQLTYDVRRLR